MFSIILSHLIALDTKFVIITRELEEEEQRQQ